MSSVYIFSCFLSNCCMYTRLEYLYCEIQVYICIWSGMFCRGIYIFLCTYIHILSCILCWEWVVLYMIYFFAYFSESALTHEISSLKTTAARLKFKGIDGGLHKRWSMWFNSKQRAEPYQSLQYTENNGYALYFGIQALHGCRQFVAWAVGLSPRTNATLLICVYY